MEVSQKRMALLVRIFGKKDAEKFLASLGEKPVSCMKPSGKGLLVEAPQKKTNSYSMRKEDIELFRAIRGCLLFKTISAIGDGASPNAVYHHPAKEEGWSFCLQYEGKTALQVAVLEQAFEPNDVKKGKFQKIIDFLKKNNAN